MEWRDEVSVEVEAVVRATDKAILVRLEDEDQEVWIIQSQISDNSEVYGVGDSGTLIISPWMAQEKGLC